MKRIAVYLCTGPQIWGLAYFYENFMGKIGFFAIAKGVFGGYIAVNSDLETRWAKPAFFRPSRPDVDYSGDILFLLGFRGAHVFVTYTYASTVRVKTKSHPD